MYFLCIFRDSNGTMEATTIIVSLLVIVAIIVLVCVISCVRGEKEQVTHDDDDLKSILISPDRQLEDLEMTRYLTNYVHVDQEEVRIATILLMIIINKVNEFLRHNMEAFDFIGVSRAGSTMDRTKVIQADEFDVLLKFRPYDGAWNACCAKGMPGRLIKKTSYHPRNRYGNYLDNSNLHPARIRSMFQSLLQRCLCGILNHCASTLIVG